MDKKIKQNKTKKQKHPKTLSGWVWKSELLLVKKRKEKHFETLEMQAIQLYISA